MQQSLMAGFMVKGGKRMSAYSPQGWSLVLVLLASAGLLQAAPDGSGPAPVISTAAPASGSRLSDASRSNLRGWNLRQTPVVEVVRRVRDAVVNIHSERTVRNSGFDEMFSNSSSQSRVNGMGTGILIDPRGYIVTNQHVVEDVALIRIRLADGTTANARVLARDHECDLALLKIDVDRLLPTIPLGTTRDLMVGETVVAIGNAYGYEHTVTVGVVSATSRDVSLNKEVSYKALIQTDASINPGNSGGPLLNVHGELIGVNVAIRAGAQGIGFAIPVDTMIRVAGRMLASRRPRVARAAGWEWVSRMRSAPPRWAADPARRPPCARSSWIISNRAAPPPAPGWSTAMSCSPWAIRPSSAVSIWNAPSWTVRPAIASCCTTAAARRRRRPKRSSSPGEA